MQRRTVHHAPIAARAALPALVLMTSAATASAQATTTQEKQVTLNKAANQITAERLTIRATNAGQVIAEVDDGPRLTASVIDLLSADGTQRQTLTSSRDGQLMIAYDPALTTPKVQIGVTMEPVSGALASQLGLDDGQAVLLSSVKEGEAADKAGLRQHDVVTRVNGQSPVTPKILRETVKSSSPGDKISLEIMRGGKTRQVSIQVEAYDATHTALDLAYTNLLGKPLRGVDFTETKQPGVAGYVTGDPKLTTKQSTPYLRDLPLLSYYLTQPERTKDLYSSVQLQLDPVIVDGRVSILPELIVSPIETKVEMKVKGEAELALDPTEASGDVETALRTQIERLRDQLDRIEALLGEADRD